ncbi:uncharacterized protein BROUX77_000257 [Berkeleyomyces rouxiae]|uniref:uncharacterized protein n=1 Tax=Berkeleyomyces rouxiae TaxID=2035830 RepID=UPI003B806305
MASALTTRAGAGSEATAASESAVTVVPCIVLAMTITCLLVALRFLAVRHPPRSWGWEHALLLVSLAFAFVAMGASITMKVNGLGYHATIYQDKLTIFAKMLWLDGLAHALCVSSAKFCILCTYLRLLTFPAPRVLCKLILGFLVVTHLWIVISIFTACVPLSSLWDLSPLGVNAASYCHPKAVFWLNYGLHVGSDFLIFVLPIPLMFYVDVPLVQHIVLAAMPAVGLFICCISALRTMALVSHLHMDDVTYTTIGYANLTIIEIGLTVSWASILAMPYIYNPLRETQDQGSDFGSTALHEPLDIFPHNLGAGAQATAQADKPLHHLQPLPRALHRPSASHETIVWGEDITEYTRRHRHRLQRDSVLSPYYHQSLHGLRLTESQVAITQVQSQTASLTRTHSRAPSRPHSPAESQVQPQPQLQSQRNSDASGFLPIFAPVDTEGGGAQDKDGRRLSYKILNIQRSTTPSSLSLRFAATPKTKAAKKWWRSRVLADDEDDDEEWGPHPGDRRSLTSPIFAPPSS